MSLPLSPEAPDDGVGRTLAGFLANVPAAWEAASSDELNRLARRLFGQVVIAYRTAMAIVLRPDLRPFFELIGPEGKSRNADPEESRPASSPLAVSGPFTEPAEVTGGAPDGTPLPPVVVRIAWAPALSLVGFSARAPDN